ncbi:MAG TPA: SDR family oxidoreductase [Dehalococcoidia bacterium]|nr:SDR family oxidoreductase [Dehalococcoidia bacterium]
MADNKGWAVILGASSGFGGATSRELARNGFDIFGVHLDMHSTIANAEAIVKDIEAQGQRAVFINMNAADEAKRKAAVARLVEETSKDGSFVRVLMHSLAFGALLPSIADDPKARLSQKQMEMTLDVMANSLIYWAQDLAANNLLRKGSRIYAMTSSGSTKVIKSYGAVSAAKAALEAHIRQLAIELAPRGVTANAIRAGVTDTPALRRIPEGIALLERVKLSHPMGRATTPEDVAQTIAVLSDERLQWLTGNVLGVDGGEDITMI